MQDGGEKKKKLRKETARKGLSGRQTEGKKMAKRKQRLKKIEYMFSRLYLSSTGRNIATV
jgi:hypothetical protein